MDRGSDRRRRGLTKADLVSAVYDLHGGLTRHEAARVVDSILSTVKTSLVDGRPVKIQNFGVFEVISRRSRAGVDPSSGRRILIPSRRGLSFRPSSKLKSLLQKPPGRDA